MTAQLPSRSIDELLAHASWLNRLARHLVRDHDLANDLTQEVWIAAHRSPPDRTRPARPWLGEVLRNAVRMRRRSDARRARSEQAALTPPAYPSPEAVHEQLELQRHLVEAVMALDEPLRATVLLRFFEEKSSAEIAQQLGVPAGTVRWRLKTAVDRLRSELDRRCSGGRRQWALTIASGPMAWRPAWKGALLMAKAKNVTAAAAVALALVAFGTIFLWWRGASRPPTEATAPYPHAALAPALTSEGVPKTDDGRLGAIEGRVLGRDGRPVANASILLVREAGERFAPGRPASVADVRSDARGAFAFTDVPPGRYTAVAMAKGWSPGRTAVLVADGNTATVDVVLGEGGVMLSGRVLDAGAGPIPQAFVTAVLTRPGFTESPQVFVLRAATDQDGRYALYSRTGQHSVRVEAEGYAPVEAWLNLLETRTRDFELAPTARLSGRVFERGSRDPVPGAQVTLASSEERGRRVEIMPVSTDVGGYFAFPAVGAGVYLASARKGALVSSAHELVLSAAGKAELELLVDTGRSVSGLVLDHEGQPVAGAAIKVSRTNFGAEPPIMATSAPDGRYVVEGLLPGVLRLRAKLDAFPSINYQPVTVADADLKDIDLLVDRPATIEGRLLTADGQAAADADVAANTADRRPDRSMMTRANATTDDQGRFRIIVPPSQVKLTAADSAGVARTFVDLGVLAPGEVRDVLLRLAPSGRGRIAGSVTDQDGRPSAGVGITVNTERFSAVARTDDAGRFTADQLDGGTYLVVAQTEEDSGSRGPWNSTEVEVKLAPGEQRSDVGLVVPATVDIAGRVFDSDNRPVPGATVLASPEKNGQVVGGTPRRTFTDEEGRFHIKALPRLAHALTALHAAHPNAIAHGVTGTRGEVVLRFARGGQLAGTARDERGRPVTDYLLRGKGQAGSFSRQIHDPAGRFHVARAMAGSYLLTASTASGQRGTAEITIVEGEARENIEIALAAGIDLVLRVVDNNGAAVPGAEVRAFTDMSDQTKTADRDGRVAFKALPPGGKLSLFVSAPGFTTAQPRIDLPAESSNGVTLVKLARGMVAE